MSFSLTSDIQYPPKSELYNVKMCRQKIEEVHNKGQYLTSILIGYKIKKDYSNYRDLDFINFKIADAYAHLGFYNMAEEYCDTLKYNYSFSRASQSYINAVKLTIAIKEDKRDVNRLITSVVNDTFIDSHTQISLMNLAAKHLVIHGNTSEAKKIYDKLKSNYSNYLINNMIVKDVTTYFSSNLSKFPCRGSAYINTGRKLKVELQQYSPEKEQKKKCHWNKKTELNNLQHEIKKYISYVDKLNEEIIEHLKRELSFH